MTRSGVPARPSNPGDVPAAAVAVLPDTAEVLVDLPATTLLLRVRPAAVDVDDDLDQAVARITVHPGGDSGMIGPATGDR